MLTWIAIIIGLGALAIYLSITIVKPGHNMLLSYWGGKIYKILEPGTYITWPSPIQQKEMVAIERITENIEKIVVTCNVKQLPTGASAATSDNGSVAEFESKQVSLNFELSFRQDPTNENSPLDPQKAEVYIRYRQTAKDEKNKLAKLIEEVTDMIEMKFRDKAGAMTDYTDVLKFPEGFVNTIRTETEGECLAKSLPIHIVSLKLNNPFKPVDKTLEESLEKIAKESFLKRAAEIEFEKEKRIAAQKKEITVTNAEAEAAAIRIKAKAQAESIQTIAKALSAEKLPDKEQAAFLLTKEALGVYEKMFADPGTKYVISGNVMDEIKAMLSKFTGRTP